MNDERYFEHNIILRDWWHCEYSRFSLCSIVIFQEVTLFYLVLTHHLGNVEQ